MILQPMTVDRNINSKNKFSKCELSQYEFVFIYWCIYETVKNGFLMYLFYCFIYDNDFFILSNRKWKENIKLLIWKIRLNTLNF